MFVRFFVRFFSAWLGYFTGYNAVEGHWQLSAELALNGGISLTEECH